MDIFSDFINFVGSFSFGEQVAFLAFLVSALSAYNSSRAIKISQQAEKRIEKSEELSNRVKLREKQSEGGRLLNEALMKLTQSKTSIELCQLSLRSFFDLSSDYISQNSKTKFEIDIQKTVKAINDIEPKISEIELKVRETYKEVEEETDLVEIDKKLFKAGALNKNATMEFQKTQRIQKDVSDGVKIFRDVTLKKIVSRSKN